MEISKHLPLHLRGLRQQIVFSYLAAFGLFAIGDLVLNAPVAARHVSDLDREYRQLGTIPSGLPISSYHSSKPSLATVGAQFRSSDTCQAVRSFYEATFVNNGWHLTSSSDQTQVFTKDDYEGHVACGLTGISWKYSCTLYWRGWAGGIAGVGVFFLMALAIFGALRIMSLPANSMQGPLS
jgi:hypothetical protein